MNLKQKKIKIKLVCNFWTKKKKIKPQATMSNNFVLVRGGGGGGPGNEIIASDFWVKF